MSVGIGRLDVLRADGTDRWAGALRRIGDDCWLHRARALRMMEPCAAGSAAMAANAAAMLSATVSEWAAIRNEIAARIPPKVCPVSGVPTFLTPL